MEDNNPVKQFNDEEESSFDIMEWVYYFLHHWYLFVIGVIVALAVAYFKNLSYLPNYQTEGRVMIEENRGMANNGSQALMQGFNVQQGFKNAENQVIMLSSRDLIAKVIDSLPTMKVDYIAKSKFITQNLYNESPIRIETNYIAPEAYGLMFKIASKGNNKFTITVDGSKSYTNFQVEGYFGKPIQHNLFFITVNKVSKSELFDDLNFRFRSKDDLVGDFSGRLALNYVQEGSSVLKIIMSGETPDRDIDFINKLCETFLADNLEKKNDAAIKTMKFIDSQLGLVEKKLAVSEGEMTRFRKTNKIVDVSSHANELLGKATEFDSHESELKLREMYLDYLTKYLRTNLDDGSVIAPSTFGVNEASLVSLIQKVNDLRDQRSNVTEKNVYYHKYTKEIEDVKKLIMEMVKNYRVTMNIEKSYLSSRASKVNKEIEELPEKELEMVAIERKYKMDDNYYTYFLQKRAEAEIQKASNTPDNTILDKARVTGVTNGDNKSKTIMFWLMLGLLLPTLFVIIKEVLNNTVRTTRDIEKNSPFPLVGSIRHTQSTENMLVAKNPRSAFTEMFRVIRTRVEFIAQRKSDIMIMITSTESGDGKTYFSINLASVYAMASPRVLLVDMDIRKPSINNKFNLKDVKGVSNFLVNQGTLDELIIRVPGCEFDILPAGTVPPNPGELIRSSKLQDMFAELRTRYEYIIVDTSPIGLVADAYSITSTSDVNLFVVRSGKTNKAFFKRLCQQLKTDKVPNTYTVFNDVVMDGNPYAKYSGGRYGYSSYGYGYLSKTKKREALKNYMHYYADDSDI